MGGEGVKYNSDIVVVFHMMEQNGFQEAQWMSNISSEMVLTDGGGGVKSQNTLLFYLWCRLVRSRCAA